MTESNDTQVLSQLLAKAGWRDVGLDKPKLGDHLSCAFISEYALLGIVLSQSAHAVLRCWADCQAALMLIAKDDAMANLKDHYLVFFINEIEDSDREELRRVTDDTHECRKTCVETRGRTIDSALAELPFISGVASESQSLSDADGPDSELAAAGLNSSLLDDLGKRRASVILEQWLEGNYCQETNTDASEEN